MSFEKGSVSFRMFYVLKALPSDAVERFAEHAAPPLNSLTDGVIHGWVSGRHLRDRVITQQNAYYGGFLRLQLVLAERKIPATLLKTECEMEELALMESTGQKFLTRAAKKDIKAAVVARLLPTMPPHLKGFPFVYDEREGILYASTLTDKQMDVFNAYFAQTLGFNLVAVSPETAAMHRLHANVREWAASSFSPMVPDTEAMLDVGEEFLTWLWFYSEARGGLFKHDDLGEFAVMIDGPLNFVNEGGAAQNVVVRQGEPRLCVETKSALLGGKKLKQAKLTLAQGDAVWSCTFSASGFVVRSLKLPASPKMDSVSLFQERINHLSLFHGALMGLFDVYVRERNDASSWSSTVNELHDWVSERKVRN